MQEAQKGVYDCALNKLHVCVSGKVLFGFKSKAREQKKRGGVTILLNNTVQCKRMSYGNYSSFENDGRI